MENLIKGHLTISQVINLFVREAMSSCFFSQLIEWVINHDLTACLERELEDEVEECLELLKTNLNFCIRIRRAEDFDGKLELRGHRTSTKDD